MTDDSKLVKGLTLSFYAVLIVYWLQTAVLGLKLYHTHTIGQAVSLMSSSKLLIVELIENYFATTQGFFEFFWMSIQDISFPFIFMMILAWVYLKDNNAVRPLIFLVALVPLITLTLFGLLMRAGTTAKAFGYANILGFGLMAVCIGIVLYLSAKIVLELNK